MLHYKKIISYKYKKIRTAEIILHSPIFLSGNGLISDVFILVEIIYTFADIVLKFFHKFTRV